METVVQAAEQDARVTVLSIEGDASDTDRDLTRLEPLLQNLLGSGIKYLVVDMSEVTAIGCQTLAQLFWAAMLLRAEGGDMAFAAATGDVAATLDNLGVERMVNLWAGVDEAVAAVCG